MPQSSSFIIIVTIVATAYVPTRRQHDDTLPFARNPQWSDERAKIPTIVVRIVGRQLGTDRCHRGRFGQPIFLYGAGLQ
jgi:hypothetical protein